jgi:hypothetical protein
MDSLSQTAPRDSNAAARGALAEVESVPRSLSILTILPSYEPAARKRLLALGRSLDDLGDHYRAISIESGMADEPLPANRSFEEDSLAQSAAVSSRSPGVYRAARFVLRRLLQSPTDIVQCASLHATYAAFLAIYLLAFCRPRSPQPALVTIVYGERTAAQYAVAARRLRYLCDALILTSHVGLETVIRQGFPSERVALLQEEDMAGVAVRDIYLEAHARASRWAQPLVSYEF